MPFEEIPHTADWSLRVWASDLPGLFAEAAHGMSHLAGTRLEAGPRVERSLELSASNAESLLVSFLSEILFIGEQERLGFDGFQVTLESGTLKAALTGAPIQSIDKVIKAVTFHNLHLRQVHSGVEVELVFDV